MINASRNSRLETGNGWIRIRSPRSPALLWMEWVPTIGLAIAGFFFHFLWIAVGVFALVNWINYRYAMNAYPQFEVWIDFEIREITWSGAHFNKDNLYGLTSYAHVDRISFEQIAYLAAGIEMLRIPCIVLVLKNREEMLLSTFDSLWSRDKVLSAVESHLHRRN